MSPTPEPGVSLSDIEVIKKDISKLNEQVEKLSRIIDIIESPNDDQTVAWAKESELESLRMENKEMKEQIELLTSGFFEIDGLRFDKNGSLISVPIIENEVIEKKSDKIKLTTTRSYDGEGRLIEVYSRYSGYNSMSSVPYYWRKTLYEYGNKYCKTTIRTYRSGLPAGVDYEEEITDSKYW